MTQRPLAGLRLRRSFFDAVPLDINIRALNGEDYIISTYRFIGGINGDEWYNPNGNPIPAGVREGGVTSAPNAGWYKSAATVLTQATATPLDRNLKAQYQDEIISAASTVRRNLARRCSPGTTRAQSAYRGFRTFANPADRHSTATSRNPAKEP